MDRGSSHCTECGDKNHPKEKEMKKGKMVVQECLTNNQENKRSKKQRREKKIYPTECKVPENSKET